MPARAYEGLLLNGDQCIREGFSSNFFAVIDQAVHTAEHGILQGISRRIVLEQLPSDVVVVYQAPHLNRLPDMAEAFLSSSSRGVVPIVSINDETVGSGEPGPTTRDLNERYDAWVQSHLEPI